MTRLLIVDDDAGILHVLRNSLNYLGYEVCGEAVNGLEAFNQAKRLNPDLVLMDIVMPGEMDGIEAAKKIRAELDIPVIFLTGYSDDALINRAKCAEPFGYIVKPYDEAELKTAIEIGIYRKDQERKLKHTVSVYKEITEASTYVFWLFASDYRKILYVSPSYETMWGRSIEALRKNPLDFLDAVHPYDRKSVLDDMERQRAGKVTEQYYRIFGADGSFRWIKSHSFPIMDDAGGLLRIAGICEDITQRRQAEAAIHDSEEQLRALMNATKDSAILIDREGTISSINKAGAERFWKKEDELIGQNIYKLLPPDLAIKRKEVVDSIFETGNPCQFRDCRANFIIDSFLQPIHDTAGKISKIAIFGRDVTDQIRMEEEKTNLNYKYGQLQKGESLGRMAGAIAHHFNNKLGVVIGNLELVIDELPKDSDLAGKLAEIMKAADKAAELSSLMLTYLGQTSGARVPKDISEVCRSLTPLLQSMLTNNVGLKADLPVPGPVVSTNEALIQQILSHLITNACDSMAKKIGVIYLRVRTVKPADISAERRPIDWKPVDINYACLEVQDEGTGIADADIDNLFDPFFSSKATGRGLGLPLVLGIVKAHAGAVEVDSAPGRGSVFRVFLPTNVRQL